MGKRHRWGCYPLSKRPSAAIPYERDHQGIVDISQASIRKNTEKLKLLNEKELQGVAMATLPSADLGGRFRKFSFQKLLQGRCISPQPRPVGTCRFLHRQNANSDVAKA